MTTLTPPAIQPSVSYALARAGQHLPELQGLWDGPAWGGVAPLAIDQFHPESRSRHPRTQAKLLYDDEHLYVHFRVEDRHVESIYTEYQSGVCRDSCVEIFLEPKPGKGYFNFEMNCGGAMLLFHMVNHRLKPEGGFVDATPVPYELGKLVRIHHSMPRQVLRPIHTPVTWYLEMAIPLKIMAHFVGPIDTRPGAVWRANLYKCGGTRMYYHWASWSPINAPLNFHRPEFFAPLTLSPASPASPPGRSPASPGSSPRPPEARPLEALEATAE